MRTTADNYVALRIKTTDDAKPDLTDLKAKLDELGAKVATARAKVDTAEADVPLAALDAKLAALNKKVASPRIDMAGAQSAVAQALAVQAAMQGMDDAAAKAAEDAAAREAAAAQAAAAAEAAAAEEAAAAQAAAAQEAADREANAARLAGLGIDDLQAKLNALSARVATARATVDDKEALLTLTGLDLRLKKVADKVVDPKITMRGADKALADMLAVDVAMDKLQAKADRLKAESDAEAVKGGVLTRFLGGSGGGGLLGLLGKIPGFGGSGGGEAAQAGEGAAGGNPYVTAGLAGLIGVSLPALLTELDAVASGFAAAGAGAGAFALLALPAVKSMTTEMQTYDAALAKYQQAVALEKEDPTKAHAAAVKSALDQVNLLGEAYQKLPAAEQKTEDGIYRLRQEYAKLSSAFTPEAFKVFSGILQVANNLLPGVTPFAKTFADSLSGLLGQAASFTGSRGFADWLAQFHALEGPSITAIGEGIGHVVTSLGKLLTIMSAKDVVNGINIAFSILDGVVIALGASIRSFMQGWDFLTTGFDRGVQAVRTGGHDIAAVWDTVRHGAAEMGHDVASAFDAFRRSVASQVGGTLNWVRSHWGLIAAFVGDPVGTAAGEVQRHWDQMVHSTAAAWDRERHEVSAAAAGMRHDVAAWLDRIRADVFRWAGGVGTGTGQAVGWFQRLPGRIAGALARLPGQLFDLGRHAVSMLVSGLESISVIGPVVGWAQDIWDHLPHSPARKGPLSGGGSPDVAGRRIAQMLASGMRAGLPDVSAASAHMAGAVNPRVGYGAYAAGGNGKLQIELLMGNNALLKAMQVTVREAGGDPAMFQKKVAYR